MQNDVVRAILKRKLRRRNGIDAVRAALRVCAPSEAEGLIEALLDASRARPNAETLTVAAQYWGNLSQKLRDRLLDRVGDIDRLINALTDSDDAHARVTACRFISDTRRTDGFARLRPLLIDRTPAVRDAAANALCLAEERADCLEDVRVVLDELLAFAASTFTDHRRRDVMDMVARRLDDPGPALRAWLRAPDEAGLMGLRAALRRANGRNEALRAFRLAAHPALGGACAEGLASIRTDDEREPILARRALLARESRRVRIGRAPIPGALLGATDAVALLGDEARRGAVDLLRFGAMDESERIARLAALLRDPSARVRLAAVRTVADARRDANTDGIGPREGLLADFAHDDDARVARAAAVALASDRTATSLPRRRVFSNLLRSKHTDVRRVTSGALDATDPWRSHIAARLWLADDRDGFVRALRERIARANDPRQRIGAAMLTSRLRLVNEVELELLGAACAADVHVAATAARSLGAARSEASRAALVRLCDHSDARVRANALDALITAIVRRAPYDTAHAAPFAAFERALTDQSPRCVGAAVVGLTRDGSRQHPDALAAAAALVRGGTEPVRAAGLWAAERAGLTELSEDVSAILRAPVSEDERRRAARCARALLRRYAHEREPVQRADVSSATMPASSPSTRNDDGTINPSPETPEVVVTINAREMAW